ncbi:unnamed protein product [Cuscuta campestris]|uniref:Uncharacterized protein n=1 Tax=Cuscuta campestris TaxID=132261 RepID=A0A484MG65_9ASTE|nr:unnamed protein product [Cuscuta campestris]
MIEQILYDNGSDRAGIILKILYDNGSEEILGDQIAEPQITFDCLDQATRVLKDHKVPEADHPDLAVQLL